MARATRLSSWALVKAAAGKVWNAPNTALGVVYGGLGMILGAAACLLDRERTPPRVRWRANALQFTHNPFGGVGAITIGNTTTYRDDPYSPEGRRAWAATEAREGHPIWEHERQHTLQGQQLGPFYLLSNLAGGLTAWLLDRDWHGPHNWNERGPQSHPPRPWRFG